MVKLRANCYVATARKRKKGNRGGEGGDDEEEEERIVSLQVNGTLTIIAFKSVV